MADKIKTHRELKVYQLSFELGMEIFKLSKNFPKEETYSLTFFYRKERHEFARNAEKLFAYIAKTPAHIAVELFYQKQTIIVTQWHACQYE